MIEPIFHTVGFVVLQDVLEEVLIPIFFGAAGIMAHQLVEHITDEICGAALIGAVQPIHYEDPGLHPRGFQQRVYLTTLGGHSGNAFGMSDRVSKVIRSRLL